MKFAKMIAELTAVKSEVTVLSKQLRKEIEAATDSKVILNLTASLESIDSIFNRCVELIQAINNGGTDIDEAGINEFIAKCQEATLILEKDVEA
jgi:hypothetical protein